MAVVINDFEVVPEAPGGAGQRGAGESESQSSRETSMSDEELRRVLAELRELDLRTWSH
jgi:hypothetical protein